MARYGFIQIPADRIASHTNESDRHGHPHCKVSMYVEGFPVEAGLCLSIALLKLTHFNPMSDDHSMILILRIAVGAK